MMVDGEINDIENHEEPNEATSEDVADKEPNEQQLNYCNLVVKSPDGELIHLKSVSCNEQVSFLRTTLSNYIETCSLTNYNFELQYTPAKTSPALVINDYTTISSIVIEYIDSLSKEGSSNEFDLDLIEIPLNLTHQLYDARRIREQVKRVHDILSSLPQFVDSSKPKSDNADQSVASAGADASLLPVVYPTNDLLLSTAEPKLSEFYDYSLHRIGWYKGGESGDGAAPQASENPLAGLLSGVSLSNYNPPPGPRLLQGDLAYVEVSICNPILTTFAISLILFVARSLLSVKVTST